MPGFSARGVLLVADLDSRNRPRNESSLMGFADSDSLSELSDSFAIFAVKSFLTAKDAKKCREGRKEKHVNGLCLTSFAQ
jgi:hypothetical protein